MAWAVAAAVTLVVVLFLLNRRAAAAVVALAVVLGGVLWFVTDSGTRERAQQRQALTARAAIDPAACADPAQPIMVEFQNGNDRPVVRLSFELTARLQGHSSVAYRAILRSDRIMEPGETAVVCYGLLPHGFAAPRPVNPDLTSYDWAVELSLVDLGR